MQKYLILIHTVSEKHYSKVIFLNQKQLLTEIKIFLMMKNKDISNDEIPNQSHYSFTIIWIQNNEFLN